jgi:hypothetical protein
MGVSLWIPRCGYDFARHERAVTVSGAPLLLLNDGGAATCDTRRLNATIAVFDYTVASCQVTTDLVVSGIELPSTSANPEAEIAAPKRTNMMPSAVGAGLALVEALPKLATGCPYRKRAPWKGTITQWETDPPGNFRSSR